MTIENASGLSRVNRSSAKALADIFRIAGNRADSGAEFLASMGINGTDGTMRRRLGGLATEDCVRAKSGSLSDAVSLVGLAQVGDRKYVFAFVFNDQPYANGSLQGIEEELLSSLARAR